MVKSKRLEPIKKLAYNREKTAAKLLGESVEAKKIEEAKLERLEQYRREYLAGMDEKVKTGVSGATLQHYHQFLSKLDVAIKQQKEVISRCQQRIAANQSQWQNDHGRHEAIGKVMDRLKVKENQVREKKELSQSDEISTQAFLRRQNSSRNL